MLTDWLGVLNSDLFSSLELQFQRWTVRWGACLANLPKQERQEECWLLRGEESCLNLQISSTGKM